MALDANGAFTATVSSLAEAAIIPCRGAEQVTVSFVVGAANLTDFLIEGRAHRSAGWIPLATAGGDFTTPVYPVRKASGDLNTAAAGATPHFFIMDVPGLTDIRLQAAGTSSTITGFWATR